MSKRNQPSFADILADAVGAAITDIRQRVIEEPWFGQMLHEYTTSGAPPDYTPERDAAIDL